MHPRLSSYWPLLTGLCLVYSYQGQTKRFIALDVHRRFPPSTSFGREHVRLHALFITAAQSARILPDIHLRSTSLRTPHSPDMASSTSPIFQFRFRFGPYPSGVSATRFCRAHDSDTQQFLQPALGARWDTRDSLHQACESLKRPLECSCINDSLSCLGFATCRIDSPWQIAFPGGRQEPDDENSLYTAMRETWEEVGLDLAERDYLYVGQLDDREITTSLGKRLLMILSPHGPCLPFPDSPQKSREKLTRVPSLPSHVA
jgi:hypothetical protein